MRYGGADDAATLGALLRATDRFYEGEDGLAPAACYDELARRALVGPHPCEVALAELDGRVVAYATFAMVYPGDDLQGQLQLKELYSDVRSQGVGAAMLRFLAMTARSRGCSRVDWTADVGNVRALDFYDRLGARRMAAKVSYRLDGDRLRELAGGPAS